MDWQTAINFGGSALIGAIGWFARQLWTAVNNLKTDVTVLNVNLKKDVTDLGLHVSENYVKKSELQTFKTDMDKRFDRIEMLIDKLSLKLDAKADK